MIQHVILFLHRESRFKTPDPPDPVADLLSDFKRLLDEGLYTDVELQCKNETIKCHRLILALRCDFFRAMFESQMAEAATRTIKLQNLDSDVLRIVVSYLYIGWIDLGCLKKGKSDGEVSPFCTHEEELEFLLRLHQAADYLLLQTLKDVCEVRMADILSSDIMISIKPEAILPIMDLYEFSRCVMLEGQLFCWLHRYFVRHPDDSALFSQLSCGFKFKLRDYVVSELHAEPVHFGKNRDLHNLLSHNSAPDLEDLKQLVAEGAQLEDVFALHKVCQKCVNCGTADKLSLVKIVDWIIGQGYDLLLQDPSGNVPLHYAVAEGAYFIVLALNYANPKAKEIMNVRMETPCDLLMQSYRKRDLGPTTGSQEMIYRVLTPLKHARIPEWLTITEDRLSEVMEQIRDMRFEWDLEAGFDGNAFLNELREVSYPKFFQMAADKELSPSSKKVSYFRQM